MSILKKDEIIGWSNIKSNEVLCPQCFNLADADNWSPITDNNDENVIICDHCDKILSI